MTKILPFKAYRYTSKAGKLDDLVISQAETLTGKENLNPNSLQHLIHADAPKSLFQNWGEKQIVKQDLLPSIYTYRQEYKFQGKRLTKKGFICKIEINPKNISTILEHEHVIDEGVNYHFNSLIKSKLIIHPLMGMYSDKDFYLERYVDESFDSPIAKVTNSSGGTDTFGAIADHEILERFTSLIYKKSIFLADGHHRYNAAIKYSQAHPGASTIMYLSNMEDKNFEIFPYHRVYLKIEGFCEDHFLNFLNKYFEFENIVYPDSLAHQLKATDFSLGLVLKSKILLLRLSDRKKSLLFRAVDAGKKFVNFSSIQNRLLLKALKLSTSNNCHVEYEVSFQKCLDDVRVGIGQFAIILPGINAEQLKMVAEKKLVLPEKTTFFFPKAVSGIVFDSITENEDFF